MTDLTRTITPARGQVKRCVSLLISCVQLHDIYLHVKKDQRLGTLQNKLCLSEKFVVPSLVLNLLKTVSGLKHFLANQEQNQNLM